MTVSAPPWVEYDIIKRLLQSQLFRNQWIRCHRQRTLSSTPSKKLPSKWKNFQRRNLWNFLISRKWGSHSDALAVRWFHKSDRLISHLRSKFYDQYYRDDMFSQGHLMVVNFPCDMRKDSFKDTLFEMNKFPKKKLISFGSSMIVREPLSCSCGPIISFIRPSDFSFRFKFDDHCSCEKSSQGHLTGLWISSDISLRLITYTLLIMVLIVFLKEKNL